MVTIITQYLAIGFLILLSFSCSNSQQPKATIDLPNVKLSVESPNLRSPIIASYDAGKTWQAIGKGIPENAEMTFIKKMDNKIVAATDNEGLFISADNLQSWNQIGANLPAKKIQALYIDDNTIFVSVYKKGIYRSKDEGNTWSELNYDLPELKVQTLLKVDDRLIAGTDSGIYILEEGKKKWESVFAKGQIVSLIRYKDKIVAGGVTGLYLSDDKGQNWESIHNGGSIHYMEVIDGKIFGMYISGELFISNDWGVTWITAKYGPKSGSYVYDVSKVGDQYFLSNNYGIHRSTNGGLHWEHIYFEEDWGVFEFLVKDNVLYGGTRTWREFRGKSK